MLFLMFDNWNSKILACLVAIRLEKFQFSVFSNFILCSVICIPIEKLFCSMFLLSLCVNASAPHRDASVCIFQWGPTYLFENSIFPWVFV